MRLHRRKCRCIPHSFAAGHHKLEERHRSVRWQLVATSDRVTHARGSENLLWAGKRRFAGRQLHDGSSCVFDELVRGIQGGRVIRDTKPCPDPYGIDRHTLGDESGEIMLVEATGHEDPRSAKRRGVEALAALASEGRNGRPEEASL